MKETRKIREGAVATAKTPTTVLSHWSQLIPGLQQSSKEFYRAVEGILTRRNLDKTVCTLVEFAEGGIFSAKREYLQVRRKEHVFHICAAPFADGFFVSSWLGHIESGFFAWLASLPLVGWLFHVFVRPLTYYKIDTALMFQSVTHGAVLEALDGLTQAKGIRALTESERKPVMRDFFKAIGG